LPTVATISNFPIVRVSSSTTVFSPTIFSPAGARRPGGELIVEDGQRLLRGPEAVLGSVAMSLRTRCARAAGTPARVIGGGGFPSLASASASYVSRSWP